MRSLFFSWRTWSNPDYILTMGSFVQVTSCDLRVDNKLFERWNYDIMISLNLLFRTLLWFFLYQDMEGNIDWLDSTAAVISLSSSYLMQIWLSSTIKSFGWEQPNVPKRNLAIFSQLTQPINLPSKVITFANQEKWPGGMKSYSSDQRVRSIVLCIWNFSKFLLLVNLTFWNTPLSSEPRILYALEGRKKFENNLD